MTEEDFVGAVNYVRKRSLFAAVSFLYLSGVAACIEFSGSETEDNNIFVGFKIAAVVKTFLYISVPNNDSKRNTRTLTQKPSYFQTQKMYCFGDKILYSLV